MARAETITLLPLDRFATIMGVNPIHFNSAKLTSKFPANLCKDRWRQYDWQDDGKISRDGIAREIARAERDIAAQFSYWPSPNWIENEEVMWPRHHRPDRTSVSGLTSPGTAKSIQLDFGRFIEAGRRAVTAVGLAAGVVYTDEDDDDFDETATITVAGVTQTDACRLKVYTAGKLGARQWEIRPHRSKTLVGGLLTITFWTWQLILPELWEALVGAFTDVDLDDPTDKLALTVDVYYEYTDPTESANLYWAGESGNTFASGLTNQAAALRITDAANGLVSPLPASYAAGEWTDACWPIGYEPERVVANYYSGLNEGVCNELPDDLALAIAYMATARMSAPLCRECQNLRDRELALKVDYAKNEASGTSYFLTKLVAESPFGTRKGEVDAWEIVSSRLARHGRQGKVGLL